MIALWAQEETLDLDLGDVRLEARATSIVATLGARPNLSIPAACQGRAEMEATYRFFDNERVTFEKLLQPHVQGTLKRAAQEKVVLLVQDTTEIDLTRPRQIVAGAGELDGSRRGILLHEMQAFTPDGVPLGTAWAETINRTELKHSSAKTRYERLTTPIEEKESVRWLEGLRQARQVAQQLPQVQCVCVADSEADIYEVLSEPRGDAPLEWLIRACQPRALAPESKTADAPGQLLATVLATPVLYEHKLRIRGRQAKVDSDPRARRQPRESRVCDMEVRACAVTLRPPWRSDRELPPVTVNVVLVREADPPAEDERVEWLLLTTLPTTTLAEVKTVVEYYCTRWGIEIFFRVLKSGCRVEERRFEHVDRIVRHLAICVIVGWRTMFVCHAARECPDLDCEAIFEPSEWKAVWATVHRKKPPKKKPRLKEMVRLIASLGGFVDRAENEPGPQTVWIGLQRMYDLAWGWEAFGPEAKLQAK